MRIQDEYNLVDPVKLREFEDRMSKAFGGMLYKRSTKPGNPFYYTFAATKPHRLSKDVPSAGTNGEEFVWNPDYFDNLNDFDLSFILSHEVLHVVMNHFYAMSHRGKRYNKRRANFAMDFIVNGAVVKELEDRGIKNIKEQLSFGVVDFEDLKAIMRSEKFPSKKYLLIDLNLTKGKDWLQIYRLIEEEENKIEAERQAALQDENPPEYNFEEEESEDDESEEDDIFGNDEAQAEEESGENEVFEDSFGVTEDKEDGEENGEPFYPDSHFPISEETQQKVALDLARSFETAKGMPGALPDFIESALKELISPTLDLTKHMRNLRLKKNFQEGRTNDWTRFDRRAIAQGIYKPKRKSYTVGRFLALMDSSYSVTDTDIAEELSQLKSLEGWTGLIVPNDGIPHWEAATEINQMTTDLAKTTIVGRGGTCFDQFFRDFPRKVGVDFDAIIILTDGAVMPPPVKLAPPINTVWVVNNLAEFNRLELTFGIKVLLTPTDE